MEAESHPQSEAGSSAGASALSAAQRRESKAGASGKPLTSSPSAKGASKTGSKSKGKSSKDAIGDAAAKPKPKVKGKAKSAGSNAAGGKDAAGSPHTVEGKDAQAGASTPLGGTPLFALTRVARIMRADEDVEQLPKDSVRAMAVATEKFVQVLAEEAYLGAKAEKRKVVTYKDLSNLVHRSSFGFLDEVIPQPTPLNVALAKRAKHLGDVEARTLSVGGAAGATTNAGLDSSAAADVSGGSALADQSALSSTDHGGAHTGPNGFVPSTNGHAQNGDDAPLTDSDNEMQE